MTASRDRLATAGDAQRAIDAIKGEVSNLRKAVSIAVVDGHGELIAFLRMDGAGLETIANASNKAWTAARLRIPSKQIGDASRDPKTGFDMGYFADSRYIGWGGGVPIRLGETVIGAVGVSGLDERDDIAMAEFGVRAIEKNDG